MCSKYFTFLFLSLCCCCCSVAKSCLTLQLYELHHAKLLKSNKPEIKVFGWAGPLSESSGGESASRVLQVVGGIKFLAVVGLSSLIPFWLSVGV